MAGWTVTATSGDGGVFRQNRNDVLIGRVPCSSRRVWRVGNFDGGVMGRAWSNTSVAAGGSYVVGSYDAKEVKDGRERGAGRLFRGAPAASTGGGLPDAGLAQRRRRRRPGRWERMGRVGAACDNAAMESFLACCRRTCSTPDAGRPTRNSALRSLGRIVFKARPESPLTGYARRDRLSEIHCAAIWRVRTNRRSRPAPAEALRGG
jgi:hypothetical protein